MSDRKKHIPKFCSRCDKVYVNQRWLRPDKCPFGNGCYNCHTEEEFINHPNYKKKILLNNPVKKVQSNLKSTNDHQNGPKKERLLNEDPKWNDNNYIFMNYKTEKCGQPPGLCREDFTCPKYHNACDKRRNPSKFNYKPSPCLNAKQDDVWLEAIDCIKGDNCEYCHSKTEQQFHPNIYKSSKCKNMASSDKCPRGLFCAFSHSDNDSKTLMTHSTFENRDHTIQNYKLNLLPKEEHGIMLVKNSNDNMNNNDKYRREHQISKATTPISTSILTNETTNDHQNGYRIMCCIIDVCPKYFKKRLLYEIKDKDEYNEAIMKAKLENSENKILAKYVKKLQDSISIKEIDQAVKNFCFSLYLVFFEFILNYKWTSIYKLREIRDDYYGHAIEIGKSSETVNINHEKFNELKEQIISNLFRIIPGEEENIKFDIAEVCKRTVINDEEEYIRKIKDQIFSDYSQKILRNGKLPNGKDLSEENFHDYMINLQKTEELRGLLSSLNNQKIDETIKRVDKLEEKMHNLENNDRIPVSEIQSTTIKELNEFLKNKQKVSDSFLILTLIGFEGDQNHDFFQVLKNIASFGCWNLIMNFMNDKDYKIYDSLRQQNREYKNLVLKDLNNHNNDTSVDLFIEKCFFLKCEITNEKEEMENQMKDFEIFLNRLFKLSPSTIDFNTVAFIGDRELNFNMDTFYNPIQAIVKYSKKRINNVENLKNYLLSFLNEEKTQECFEDLQMTKMLKITADISYKHLLDNLAENSELDDPNNYYLQTKSGDKCKIERETLNKYKNYFLIYHLDFGNKNYEIENKDKSTQKEILKINFLKGEILIPKVLWLNEIAGDSNEDRILIERTVERKIIDVFYKNNKPGEIWNKPDEFFKIKHARSAGGTALSRSVLFKLRRYFICLELKKLDQIDTIKEYLEYLKETYKSNLIIMIEQDTLNSFSWTENDLCNFQLTLKNRVDKNCKILYTCRDSKICKSEFFDGFKVELSTTLDKYEKDSLSSIYPKDKDPSSSFQFRSNKIHLYPLYFFSEEFEKIDNIIEACFESIKCVIKHDIFSNKECFNCKLKLILFLMCTVEKLTNSHLNKESIALLVSKENGNARIDNLFKYYNDKELNFLTDVAVLHDKKSIKLAHSCLGYKILNKLQCLDDKLKTDQMHKFGVKMLELVKEQTSNKEIKLLLFDLLIKNKKNISKGYKTQECANRPCKDSNCENFHYRHERRRVWHNDNYKVSKCVKIFINGQWNDPGQCDFLDKCIYCHTENEFEYHPSRIKNTLFIEDYVKESISNLENFLNKLSDHYENDLFYGYIKYVLAKIKFYKDNATDIEKKDAISLLKNAFEKLNKNGIEIDADLCVHYGNLIRNFLNKFTSEKYSKNTKDYEDFFNRAKNAYQKAQETPKKTKQLQKMSNSSLSSGRLGSYNDYAFLGELLLYTKKLQILNELQKKTKFEKLLPEYETRIKSIMDTFEILSDGGQIYSSQSDEKKENTRIEDIKIKMGNELIRLLEMKKSKELGNEIRSEKPHNVIEELISNLDEKEYNIFTILKSNKILKIKSWEDFERDQLKQIVDYGKKLLETKIKPSYSTFKNLIYSLIYYGQLNVEEDNENQSNDLYNIYTALEYCKRWMQNYSDDEYFDAFFFTGIFQLTVDLQENKPDSESKKHFEDCQKKCKTLIEQNCNPSKYKYKEFVFGCGKGIKAIVPFNKRNQNIDKLKKFKGRICKQQDFYKVIEIENDLLKKYPIMAGKIPPELSKTDQAQRYFNLAFARDNLVAENFKIIRNYLCDSSDESH